MNQDKLHKLSEERLLSFLKEGNQLAFNQIYYRYWEKLYAYTYNILNEKELAEDAIHEVFTWLWFNREKLQITHLKSYLFMAVRNKAINMLDKAKFSAYDEHIMEELFLTTEGEDNLSYQDLKKTIQIAANDLPERCRDIFYKSRFEHLSNKEIAAHYNISNRTVENQLSTALKHLRKALAHTKAIFFLF